MTGVSCRPSVGGGGLRSRSRQRVLRESVWARYLICQAGFGTTSSVLRVDVDLAPASSSCRCSKVFQSSAHPGGRAPSGTSFGWPARHRRAARM